VRLYPLFHPAAALYTPSMVETLRGDFLRIPELLALPEPAQPDTEGKAELVIPEPAALRPEPRPADEEPAGDAVAGAQREPDAQLGLF
jgi:DNA polymerase